MRTRNPFPPMAAALGALLLLAGLSATSCNSSPNVMTGYERAGGGLATTIQVANPRLQKKIELVSAISRRDNDVLHISARLDNRTKKTLKFEHKLQWFDSDDFEIGDARSHWTPAEILGGDTMQIQGMAPDGRAVTFKLLVRAPAPVSE